MKLLKSYTTTAIVILLFISTILSQGNFNSFWKTNKCENFLTESAEQTNYSEGSEILCITIHGTNRLQKNTSLVFGANDLIPKFISCVSRIVFSQNNVSKTQLFIINRAILI